MAHDLFIFAMIVLGLALFAFIVALCDEAIDFYIAHIREIDERDFDERNRRR